MSVYKTELEKQPVCKWSLHGTSWYHLCAWPCWLSKRDEVSIEVVFLILQIHLHCHAMAVDSSEIDPFAGLPHVVSLEIKDICQQPISSVVGGALEHSQNDWAHVFLNDCTLTLSDFLVAFHDRDFQAPKEMLVLSSLHSCSGAFCRRLLRAVESILTAWLHSKIGIFGSNLG